ncbi:MAG: FKBP-type peptidyl-prolyl cis-trans isomerase [Alistipes sp.]|nr:FKBP-type peptidyl-prolyl cis-trans isomerase [Alistipes sp.]MBQ9962363.1 FKBP-type peptidyl-prolyl cis-trans isomerase [Alistipes sp.]
MKRIFNVAVVALIAGVMAVSCFNGSKSMVTKGDSSKLDTLSYAMGANLGEFLSTRLADLPFNYEQLEKGLQSAALGKAKWSAEQAQEVFQSLIGPVNDRFGQLMRQKQDTTAVAEPIEVFTSEGERDSLSLAYGINIGNDLRQGRFPIQMHWYMKGEQQTRNGEGLMSSEEIAQFLQNYFMVVYPQQEQEKSEAWLAKMEKKSGVQKSESGLLYKVVKEGDVSRSATDDRDEVTVHYTGRDRDGEIFDSSLFENMPKQRQEMMRQYQPDAFDEKGNIIENEPVTFPLNRVIAGWTEGMKLVGPGGKIILYIPAELAYGARGNQAIAPNAALEFEVELIDVKPFEEPKAEEKTEAAE